MHHNIFLNIAISKFTYIYSFATAACLLAILHLAIKMTSIVHAIVRITSADGITVLMVIMMGTGKLLCTSSDGCCGGKKKKWEYRWLNTRTSLEDENHPSNVAILPHARLHKTFLYGDNEYIVQLAQERFGRQASPKANKFGYYVLRYTAYLLPVIQ